MSNQDKATLYLWMVRRGIDTRSAKALVEIAASYKTPVSIEVMG